ncbi:putative copper/topaquinone oxidase [Lophiostoma macrostomum CBS 122681]|uniref:Amine oxidase n=1 Tax=Lophiostoma macrostomum CBS 122681 TaxID=1314788 RepID=A0A6A6T4X5_9PLEO|nr:putative copper/topaquinone oxidase [Lophiostoma macrostomum CBS 122681]
MSIDHHPFDPLSKNEIQKASQLICAAYPGNSKIDFRSISLYEPEKSEMISFLEAEHSGKTLAIVDVTMSKLIENTLPDGTFANVTLADAENVIEHCLSHPSIVKEIERLGLTRESVVCEPWPYGSDNVDDGKLKFQCYMFTHDPRFPQNKDGNYYAFPLDFSPVMEAWTWDILDIMYLPQHPNNWSSSKWRFRVGFNLREGLVLHDVRFDGRPAFYRLALSDMFVPYADPRPPFHRKSAFDFGDAGAGATANSLELGCDCLGLIKYFNGILADGDGNAYVKRNVICMHEQDDLIRWKHTVPSGRAIGARSRVLILQTMSTLANYEYIFLWTFDQAGGIGFEIRATGIMSTQPIPLDSTEDYKYGNIVHPGVVAPSHQHIFCMRIDPAVDGHGNEVVQSDTVAMPYDEESNPYGVGFIVQKTSLLKAGSYDSDVSKGRVWLITNPSKEHPVTRRSVAWKLHPHNSQMLLAGEKSLHKARGAFSVHQLFLTKYNRHELYAPGNFTIQSRKENGVVSWANRKDDLNGDPVIWHSFGITHIPRTEDFPVMPIAKLQVKLEPNNFFKANPAIDVPPISDEDMVSFEEDVLRKL